MNALECKKRKVGQQYNIPNISVMKLFGEKLQCGKFFVGRQRYYNAELICTWKDYVPHRR